MMTQTKKKPLLLFGCISFQYFIQMEKKKFYTKQKKLFLFSLAKSL